MNFTIKLYSIVIFLIIVVLSNNYSLAIKCIECDNSDKNCTIAPENIAKNVECKEKCFVKLEANGTITRGCGSNETCKDLDTDNCELCKDDKGPCNMQILPKTRPKCYVCKGTDCIKIDDKKTKMEYCEYLNKTSNLHCFTNVVNQNVTRGCLEKSGLTCDTPNCQNCTNTEIDKPCNKEDAKIKLSCYHCRSDASNECDNPEKNKEKIEKKECEDSGKGCYAERWNGITFRGCAEILNNNETTKCVENKNGCLICTDGSFCNGKVFNSAIINSISSALLITCVFLTRKFLN